MSSPFALDDTKRIPSDAHRARKRRNKAGERRRWREQGRCVECGGTRKYPTLRCDFCLIGNVIRVDRSQFKKRMAKVGIGKGTR